MVILWEIKMNEEQEAIIKFMEATSKMSGNVADAIVKLSAQIKSLQDEVAQLRKNSNDNSSGIQQLKNYTMDQFDLTNITIRQINWRLPPLDLTAKAYTKND